jgi:hypothetical protein
MKALPRRRQNILDLKKRARHVLKASVNLVQQRLTSKGSTPAIHIYEIRPRPDKHGFDLSGDVLPYSPLWYRGPNAIGDAVRHAKSYSQAHPVVIHFYDEDGKLIETHQHFGNFKEM